MFKLLYITLNKLNENVEQGWCIFMSIDGLKSRSIGLEYDLYVLGVDFGIE